MYLNKNVKNSFNFSSDKIFELSLFFLKNYLKGLFGQIL